MALFDQGLENLPGQPELCFERTTNVRQAFDAIVRQLLLDCPLSDAQAKGIDELFAERALNDQRNLFSELLFPSHPVLAARVVNRLWLPRIPAAQ